MTLHYLRIKLLRLNWPILLLINLIAVIGFMTLYSAGNGELNPWASRQVIRFSGGLIILMVVALSDIRVWYHHAYNIYFISFVLLIGVELAGRIGMGAQRWINLYIFQLQPSELMKIALILALSRYYHGLSLTDIRRSSFLIIPLLLILLPATLVIRQPDLGTAILLIMGGGSLIFLAGIRLWKVAFVAVIITVSAPFIWSHLRSYQKERILTFLSPERDPLGSGYNILQSKIALGSGGIWGRGFMKGSQSHLNFLPEKQTDFIFSTFSEEFGLIGSMGLLTLYSILIGYGYKVSLNSRNTFGRFLAMGVTTILSLYVFINMAMVMGLVPAVGIPLPLISYGGTSMLTLLMGFGFLMSVDVHKDLRLGKTAL
jgi:rod shape determining protein RodA